MRSPIRIRVELSPWYQWAAVSRYSDPWRQESDRILSTRLPGRRGGLGARIEFRSNEDRLYIKVDSQVFGNVYNDTGGDTISGTKDSTGINGNPAVDPLFSALSDDSDVSNDDWSLATGSPCIDAGFPQSSHNDADGTANDMGAFGGPNSDWEN